MYTVNGGRVAVWNQPVEVREMRKDGRWTVDELAARFDEVGQEPMPILERAQGDGSRREERRQAEPVASSPMAAVELHAWKGEPAVTLRADEYEATFLPGCGMLCTSLQLPRRGVRRLAALPRRLPRPGR